MTDEQRKAVEALSEKHFARFGRTPTGALKYKWARTDEMFALFKRGHEEKRTESGLIVAESLYERRSFVDLYRLCWTVAKWYAPISRGQWLALFGTEHPWPREGFYAPIENIMRHIDMIPDEAVTENASRNLARHLEMTPREHFEAVSGEYDAQEQERLREWQDFVADSATAFGNNPGGKGSTSFPTALN